MSEPVVFNHIPKTAGTALTDALAATLAADRMCSGMDHFVLGSFTDVSDMEKHARRQLVASPEELPDAPDLVAGHFTPSTTRAKYPGARDLTVLREARTRLISQWLFARAHTEADLKPWGAYAELIRLGRAPLAGYLLRPEAAPHTDNHMARFLTWPHPCVPDHGFIDERDDADVLAAARASLARFSFADVLEVPGFVDRLADWLGRPLGLGSVNEMPAVPVPLRPDIASEVNAAGELLASRTRLDQQLWMDLVRDLGVDDPAAFADDVLTQAVSRYQERLAQPPGPRPRLHRRLSYKVRYRLQRRRVRRG